MKILLIALLAIGSIYATGVQADSATLQCFYDHRLGTTSFNYLNIAFDYDEEDAIYDKLFEMKHPQILATDFYTNVKEGKTSKQTLYPSKAKLLLHSNMDWPIETFRATYSDRTIIITFPSISKMIEGEKGKGKMIVKGKATNLEECVIGF